MTYTDQLLTYLANLPVIRDGLSPAEDFRLNQLVEDVEDLVVGVTINGNNSVEVNANTLLKVEFDPANTSHTQGNWSVDNNLIATVNNGLVTGVAEGNATISFESIDGPTDNFLISVVNAS